MLLHRIYFFYFFYSFSILGVSQIHLLFIFCFWDVLGEYNGLFQRCFVVVSVVSGVSQGSPVVSIRIIWGCFGCISRCVFGFLWVVSEVSWGFLEVVGGVSWGCLSGVLCLWIDFPVSWRCLRGVLVVSQWCPGVLRECLNLSWGFLEVSWG